MITLTLIAVNVVLSAMTLAAGPDSAVLRAIYATSCVAGFMALIWVVETQGMESRKVHMQAGIAAAAIFGIVVVLLDVIRPEFTWIQVPWQEQLAFYATYVATAIIVLPLGVNGLTQVRFIKQRSYNAECIATFILAMIPASVAGFGYLVLPFTVVGMVIFAVAAAMFWGLNWIWEHRR